MQINTKQKHKRKIKINIIIDFNEYLDEKNEILCGCNCTMCNPYYGDFYEYIILQDEYIQNRKKF